MDLAVTGGLQLVELRPRGALPAPGAHPGRPRHGGQRGRDGLRQPGRRQRAPAWRSPATRAPARRASTATTCRTRRARTSWPASATRCRCRTSRRIDKASYDQLMTIMADAGEPLPRPVRHRVHHRARQALDAADPGRQADRGGGLPDRDPARAAGHDRPGRGAHPGHRRRARPADVPALRHQRRRHADHQGDQRLAGRGGRQGGLRLGHRGRVGRQGARRSSWSAARPTPTTCTA